MELAALESLPSDLVDNAAILATLSLITAALFLLDLAGPKGKSDKEIVYMKSAKPEIQLIEKQIEPQLVRTVEQVPNGKETNDKSHKQQNGYKKMKDKPKRFDIYGKDVDTDSEGSKDVEEQSPVWSKIREGELGYFGICEV